MAMKQVAVRSCHVIVATQLVVLQESTKGFIREQGDTQVLSITRKQPLELTVAQSRMGYIDTPFFWI